jgi:hypothetical protein
MTQYNASSTVVARSTPSDIINWHQRRRHGFRANATAARQPSLPKMFDLRKHQHDYFYDFATVIENLIPERICDQLASRVNSIITAEQVDHVKHQSLGTNAVSDLGGEYNHYIFKGDDIRQHLPELNAVYHALLPLVSVITCADAVVSPYPASDINIKAYPPGGGTLGLHYDTNASQFCCPLRTTTKRHYAYNLSAPIPARRSRGSKSEISTPGKAHS